MGDFAGQLNTTGCINSFFGLQAGGDNKTGADNNFFGRGAGLRNVSGGSNAYFGSLAGAASTTCGFNSYFGVAAGLSALGSENTFVGNHADFSTSNASGDKNTLLGASTMVSSGLSNATAIGACAVVTQNNSLILGSISSGTRVCLPQPDTNVGIGTPAPQARLHIVDGGGNILFTNAGCGQGFAGIMFASSVTANCQGYAILGGTDNNTYINRPAGGTIHFREANVTQLSIRPGGVVTIASLGTASNPQATLCRNTSNEIAFCNSSSLRYKNNVATFAGGMNIINRLRPILFTWKQDGTKDIGFGAEEVEKVAPLFTFRNDKGEIEGVRYDRLGVLFVNAFKEQQTKIERQQKEIGELKKLVCRSHARAAVCK